jgi:peptide/nickel transport system substrate-binding protein
MRKNPRYFRADEGLPKFDNLIFRFIGENTTEGIAALQAGECDILDSSNLEDQIELLLDLQADEQIKVSFTTSASWEHIDFGIQPREYDDGYQLGVDRPDFFSDVRTRRAFAHCMDRQALVDTILFGQSLVLDSTLPPQHPLYNPDVPHYEFDVQAGSALLEEVGWVDDDGNPETPRIAQGVTNVVDGTPLEVAYETTSGPIRQQITAVIKNSLAQCGIQARVQLYAPDEFFADGQEGPLSGRKFDLGQFAWATGGEPDCMLWESIENPGPVGETWISIMDGGERSFKCFEGCSNYSGFADQEFDQACNTAMGSLPGQPDYEAAHHEAQRIFAEQLPVVPLFPSISLSVTRPDMCGYIMDPSGGSFWNIEEFDYGEGCEE